jgi:hypothetical protein
MPGVLSGWLWLAIDVIFVCILAALIVYGGVAWRNRNKSPEAEAARDRATKRLYEQEERSRR